MTDFRAVLKALSGAGAEVIVIGGVAGQAHGSARTTVDVDFVYRRTKENMDRIAAALAPHSPYLRGAPPGLPFRLDEPTLSHGLNFTLMTELGAVDLLGEIAGGGRYEDLLSETSEVLLFGLRCRVLDLPCLIRVKRAAGRPKDIEAIAELEALLEESRGQTTS